ncbi:thiamine pyrophosphokinase Thi80 [Histoplasma capsulatum]|uniref:Thiamine pyrophosphokinase n=1 Tax=Ajellomyces capsulatus TaxID=5037 RepID=A0A8A1M6F2_AJECA|nr:thiamine pyrophosphokinase Thi80 [Histoplasma capsulatum]
MPFWAPCDSAVPTDTLKHAPCFSILLPRRLPRSPSLFSTSQSTSMYTESSTSMLPDAIVGDLDSILPEVRKHYEDLHVPVIHNPDQYSTDVTKCLRYLRSRTQSLAVSSSNGDGTAPPAQADNHDLDINVLLLGGLGGRVDQAFSLINHLCISSTSSSSSAPPHTQNQNHLYLISEQSISFLLHRGHNRIHTPGGSLMGTSPTAAPASSPAPITTTMPFAENVGIIPIAGPAVITTRGLEWDITDWKTQFGGQVSTSNHVRSDVVEVEVPGEAPVLFTLELAAWVNE